MKQVRAYSSSHGQVLVLGVVFMGVFTSMLAGLANYGTTFARTERYTIARTQALALAEAGIEKAAYELNENGTYSGETGTVLSPGQFTVTVTTIDGSTKRITATGYVPNTTSPRATRTVKATLNIDSNVIAFNYGVQTGNGGFVLTGGSTINGSIYANGPIVATNGVHITGSAIAANQPATTTDQANDTPTPISSCTSSTCITFANSTSNQDFAQSFRISSAVSLNNIAFYIKKTGAPSDATVRIVNDASGVPGTDTLMTGTLSASAVTTSFGWVSVTMPTTPVLDPNTTYWIVIDGGSSSTKYYTIGASTSYANGTAKIGRYGSTWSDTSPSSLDGYFRIYLGGGTSSIGGSTYIGGVYVGSGASDIAWAHYVQGAQVAGIIYCQSGTYNNKTCDTSRTDPDPQPMPVSDGNIQDWKDEAEAGGIISGDYTVGWAGATLGPKKITGNLTVNGGGTLTVSGTLWVEGNVIVTGGGKVRLSSSYGTASGVIVSDGRISIDGGAVFSGSGTTGSYPFLVTTSACPTEAGCSGNDAIYLSGGAGAVALIAQNGNANISGGSGLKQVTAKQITMGSGATLTYDSGLANSSFSTGPGGSWQIVPGSYVIVP